MLSNRAGPFASCHSELSPKDYVHVCFDLSVVFWKVGGHLLEF